MLELQRSITNACDDFFNGCKTDDRFDLELYEWFLGLCFTLIEDEEEVVSRESALLEKGRDFLGPRGLNIEENYGLDISNCVKVILETSQDYRCNFETDVNKLDKVIVFNKENSTSDPNKKNNFVDPFLGIGLSDNKLQYNKEENITELLKVRKTKLKERNKALAAMREWQKGRVPWPSPTKIHASSNSERAQILDIIVPKFSVGIGGRSLLQDAELKIVIGRKYGLVGRNGIGKSTLLAALVRKEINGINKSLNISAVEQDVDWSETETPLEAVLRIDNERMMLLERKTNLEMKLEEDEKNCGGSDYQPDEKLSAELESIYARMTEIQTDRAIGNARQLLIGLGLSDRQIDNPVMSLSGGWKVRVALARALFSEPDVLLLDEPTNHLDLLAVAWLMRFIQNWNTTCIIVSHSRDFLDDTCTDIIEFKDMKLKFYRGSYSVFEKVTMEQAIIDQKQYASQKAYLQQQEAYINRFRANAAKAASVQSRIKMLAKMPRLEESKTEAPVHFNFNSPDGLDQDINLISMTDVIAGYGNGTILEGVNFSVESGSRIAVCGVNGSGKSTLLKVLVDTLEQSAGNVKRMDGLRIGYFSQHHIDALDMSHTAVSLLIERFSVNSAAHKDGEITPLDARAYLGKFGITGGLALEPLYILSGGQKSRVALALAVYNNPHLLVLDEPTNHFDILSVQALVSALNEFTGGVVIVSHDSYLLSHVVDTVYHVNPAQKSVLEFKGTVDLYKKLIIHGGTKNDPIELLKDPKIRAKFETQ